MKKKNKILFQITINNSSSIEDSVIPLISNVVEDESNKD